MPASSSIVFSCPFSLAVLIAWIRQATSPDGHVKTTAWMGRARARAKTSAVTTGTLPTTPERHKPLPPSLLAPVTCLLRMFMIAPPFAPHVSARTRTVQGPLPVSVTREPTTPKGREHPPRPSPLAGTMLGHAQPNRLHRWEGS